MSFVSDIVEDIIAEYYSYLSDCERSSTEMKKKTSILQMNIIKLRANTEIAEQYFNFQITERERLFNSASKVLEKAIKTGDVEFAQIALRTIEIVNKKSPFSFR